MLPSFDSATLFECLNRSDFGDQWSWKVRAIPGVARAPRDPGGGEWEAPQAVGGHKSTGVMYRRSAGPQVKFKSELVFGQGERGTRSCKSLTHRSLLVLCSRNGFHWRGVQERPKRPERRVHLNRRQALSREVCGPPGPQVFQGSILGMAMLVHFDGRRRNVLGQR